MSDRKYAHPQQVHILTLAFKLYERAATMPPITGEILTAAANSLTDLPLLADAGRGDADPAVIENAESLLRDV